MSDPWEEHAAWWQREFTDGADLEYVEQILPLIVGHLPDGGRLRIEPKGSEPVTLKPGEWSPWVTFTFEFNALVKLSGIGRFHLAAIAPEIQLYLSPINFNPRPNPPCPWRVVI